MEQSKAEAPTVAKSWTSVRSSITRRRPITIDPQLLGALAEILADALLADLETETEEEPAVAVATAESLRGIGNEAELLVATSTCTPDAAA